MKSTRATSLILFLSLFGVTAAALASPIGINVLSEEHHIWGEGSYEFSFDSFDITSTGPVSTSVTGSFQGGGTTTLTPASAGNFEIDVDAPTYSYAAGQSTYTFTADHDSVNLFAEGETYSSPGMNVVEISLVDLTSRTELFHFRRGWAWPNPPLPDPLPPYGQISFLESLSINSNHVFQLSMFAEAKWADDYSNSNITVALSSTPTPTPEPTTMLLFGTGFTWLAGNGLRKKRKKALRGGKLQNQPLP